MTRVRPVDAFFHGSALLSSFLFMTSVNRTFFQAIFGGPVDNVQLFTQLDFDGSTVRLVPCTWLAGRELALRPHVSWPRSDWLP